MKKSYVDINRSPINASTSKQLYSFSKASRFSKLQLPACLRASYDIGASTQRYKNTSANFTKSPRFKYRDEQAKKLTPGPSQYQVPTTFQQTIRQKHGTTFSKAQRMKTQDNIAPGPGKYNNTYNPQKQLSYTMRMKTKSHLDNSYNKVGPGKYQVVSSFEKTNYSAFNNSKSYGIGKSARFIKEMSITPGPAKYNWERSIEMSRLQTQPISKYANNGKYSFSKTPRLKYRDSTTPGPGNYQQFTEFGQLNKPLVQSYYQ